MDKFAGYNGTEAFGVPDGEAYPLSGFASDRELHYTLNDEYLTHAYFKEDANGVPMVGISFTEGLQHALYPSYAFIAWDYMEHFSRNLETGEITYTEDPTDSKPIPIHAWGSALDVRCPVFVQRKPPLRAGGPESLSLCPESSNPFPANGRRVEKNLRQRAQRAALSSI